MPEPIPNDAGDFLLPVARTAIREVLGLGGEYPAERPGWAFEPGASFVTLTARGQLRGCIGSLEARRPLLEDVRDNAVSAATRDPRFRPLAARDLAGVAIEVSVLSTPLPFEASSLEDAIARLRPGVDGVIVEVGRWNRATFLPQVWEDLPDAHEFLAHLWVKAGVRPGSWHPDTRLSTYTVRAWHETP